MRNVANKFGGFVLLLALLTVVLAGCGDPDFDPDAPVEFTVDGQAGAIVFCERFEATHLLVESRPSDNSKPWITLMEAKGLMSFDAGTPVPLDILPPETTGALGQIESFASETVSVLAVAAGEDDQNIRAEFLIPSEGLGSGSWINGRGETQPNPCQP